MTTQRNEKGKEYNTKYRKAIADAKFLNKQRESFIEQIEDLEDKNKLLQGTIDTWENLFDKLLKKYKVRNINELEEKIFGLDSLIIDTEKISCSSCRKPVEVVLKGYSKKTLKSWTSVCMECLKADEKCNYNLCKCLRYIESSNKGLECFGCLGKHIGKDSVLCEKCSSVYAQGMDFGKSVNKECGKSFNNGGWKWRCGYNEQYCDECKKSTIYECPKCKNQLEEKDMGKQCPNCGDWQYTHLAKKQVSTKEVINSQETSLKATSQFSSEQSPDTHSHTLQPDRTNWHNHIKEIDEGYNGTT